MGESKAESIWRVQHVVLAGSLLLAAATMRFKVGYATALGIPVSMVPLAQRDLIQHGALLVVLGVGILILLELVSLAASESRWMAPLYTYSPLLFVGMYIVLGISFVYGWTEQLLWAAALLAMAVGIAIVRSVLKKLEPRTFLDRVTGAPGIALMALLAALSFATTSFALGDAKARGEEELLVLVDAPGKLVLGFDGDVAILGTFDPVKKLLLPDREIVPRTGLRFKRKRIGPLTPAQE